MIVLEADLMAGAAASAFIINDAATILPRALIAKVHAYIVGAAANVLEVGAVCLMYLPGSFLGKL